MALPDAIKTVNVTFGPGTSTLGTDLEVDVSFSAPVAVVWAATGTPLINLIETERAEAGQTGTAVVPNPAQDGFIDGDGNPIRDWTYRAAAKYKRDGLKVAGPYSKTFALSETDTDVHLDQLIPVPTSNGVVVSVPDTWTQAVTDAQAAAAAAEAAAADAATASDAHVASLISMDGTATKTQLDTAIVATPTTAIARDSAGRVVSVTENGITTTYAREASGHISTITTGGTTKTVSRTASGLIEGIA